MKYDVVIVGAGPAGLTAAKVLAKNNKKVLILEKNSSVGNKVCAEGISKKTKALVPDNVIEKAYNSILVHSQLQTATLKQKEPYIWMINRNKLAKFQLKEAEKAGAKILFNSNIKNIKENSLINNNKKIEFRYLIGADGSSSIVRKSLNLKTKNLELGIQYIVEKKFNDIEVFLFGTSYLWIFPHKNFTSIGSGAYLPHEGISHIKKNLENFLSSNNIDYKKAKFQAALLNIDYCGFKFSNKFLVGDAAGFASELTGEGIYQAIVSGEDIAKGILNPNYDYPKIKHILNLKTKHSRIFRKLIINPFLTKVLHELFLILIRNKRRSKRIIKIASY